jgi:hypothetical protein
LCSNPPRSSPIRPRFVQQALAGDALTRRRSGRREIAINELALRVKALTGSTSWTRRWRG